MLKKKTQNDENLVNANKQADAERQQITELTNDLQRTRADFENYRKQMDAQRSQAVEYAKQDTVKQFLPLLDDLDRAITATPELAPLMKNLEKTVKELGLTKINSEPGTDFNPDLHDAVTMEDGEGEKEVIAETLRAGYLYNDAVLRPAMVKVKNA
ncbi:nucleotide exchange factor GrpE [Candidatus Saccharibacteria bacterium]|nr:nucleotide exchange factor GrpE [Candidatus Saccharibacteria bacterium]